MKYIMPWSIDKRLQPINDGNYNVIYRYTTYLTVLPAAREAFARKFVFIFSLIFSWQFNSFLTHHILQFYMTTVGRWVKYWLAPDKNIETEIPKCSDRQLYIHYKHLACNRDSDSQSVNVANAWCRAVDLSERVTEAKLFGSYISCPVLP